MGQNLVRFGFVPFSKQSLSKRKSTRRTFKKSNKKNNVLNLFTVIGTNANGILSKQDSRLSQFFSFPVTVNTKFKISCENAVFAGKYNEYI